MRLIKLLSITFLLACLIIGTMVACDGDGICEDFINAFCDRFDECTVDPLFEECVSAFELTLECNSIDNIPDINQCIDDLDNFDCVALEIMLLPETCTPEGACDVCESGADCPDGLFCSACTEDCTGEVNRCSWDFNVECGDGIF